MVGGPLGVPMRSHLTARQISQCPPEHCGVTMGEPFVYLHPTCATVWHGDGQVPGCPLLHLSIVVWLWASLCVSTPPSLPTHAIVWHGGGQIPGCPQIPLKNKDSIDSLDNMLYTQVVNNLFYFGSSQPS